MSKVSMILTVIGLGIAVVIAYKLFGGKVSSLLGGGGGGDDSGVHSIVNSIGIGGASARGQNSYSAVDPITRVTEPFTYKSGGTTSTGVATYYAPEVIQNMIRPGSALPAPSPGIGLAPRAIIL